MPDTAPLFNPPPPQLRQRLPEVLILPVRRFQKVVATCSAAALMQGKELEGVASLPTSGSGPASGSGPEGKQSASKAMPQAVPTVSTGVVYKSCGRPGPKMSAVQARANVLVEGNRQLQKPSWAERKGFHSFGRTVYHNGTPYVMTYPVWCLPGDRCYPFEEPGGRWALPKGGSPQGEGPMPPVLREKRASWKRVKGSKEN